MAKKVLVVAAHPDDEVLGCGGTIARHVSEGDSVDILLLADGEGARGGDGAAMEKRRDAARRCAEILGARLPRCLGFPDNRMDQVALLEVIQAVEDAAAEIAPDIVYTHHGGDLNVDHRITHQAALTAFRPVPGSMVRSIYTFEVPSSTEWAPAPAPVFVPTKFINVQPFAAVKKKALDCYADEMRPYPHPRSHEALEALARWRGATCGLLMAEAFAVIREIVN